MTKRSVVTKSSEVTSKRPEVAKRPEVHIRDRTRYNGRGPTGGRRARSSALVRGIVSYHHHSVLQAVAARAWQAWLFLQPSS